VSDEEMERVNVERNKFHGDWNYVIRPRQKYDLPPLFIYAALGDLPSIWTRK